MAKKKETAKQPEILPFDEAMKEVERLDAVAEKSEKVAQSSRERAAVIYFNQMQHLGEAAFWKAHAEYPGKKRSKGDIQKLLKIANDPEKAAAANKKNNAHQAKSRTKKRKQLEAAKAILDAQAAAYVRGKEPKPVKAAMTFVEVLAEAKRKADELFELCDDDTPRDDDVIAALKETIHRLTLTLADLTQDIREAA